MNSLRPVPAALPWIPALASSPAIAAVSSSVTPSALAIGAVYSNVYPRPSMLALLLLAVLVIISTTLAVSSTSSPNPLSVLPTISPNCWKPVPVASAPLTTPGKAFSTSLTLKPALTRLVASSATCLPVPAASTPTFSTTALSRS